MARLTALLSLALALVAGAAGAATPNYVVHERRDPGRVVRRGERVHPDAIIPLRFALTQNNLHTGYDRLMDVSHPDSPNYGKHLSAEEVHDLFAPGAESLAAVKSWLVESGIAADRIMHYANKGWLAVDVAAGEANRLLRADYYERSHGGSVRIGCDEYSLPAHVAPHVDFVKPGITLSSPLKKRVLDKRSKVPPVGMKKPAHLAGNLFPDWTAPPASAGIAPDLRNCGVNISVQCIQALYQLPHNNYSDAANAMGLFETYDAWDVEDIQLFFAHFIPYVPSNTEPEVISVDGGTSPVKIGSPRAGGESIIDIDLAQSIVYPQKVIVYQVDDLPNSFGKTNTTGFLNTFLDSVDGSYCNYTAYGITGDSPGIDAQYPDTEFKNGYKGALECGTYTLTRVVSISYGEPEIDLPKKYVERQCNEFMKLGLQGHSILAASGDYGVASFPGENGDAYGCLSAPGMNGTIYNPDYPVGCPYVLAVGGTRLYPTDTVLATESAMQVNLTAFNIQTGEGSKEPELQFFASGGGFSNYFKPPSYQAEAVSNYLSSYGPDVPSYVVNGAATNVGEGGGVYNRAGRAYPDVAANGAFLRIFLNATELTFFGTSLASPIFGSVLTLINENRSAANKSPIGFPHPVLYANPQILNDVTNGSNPNCGSSGFKTAPGWDPVTGLGTPNYPKMLDLWMSLQ